MDEHEEKAIEVFLSQINPEGNKFFWIGLTDLAQEGVWVWFSTGKQPDYMNWIKGEPNNGGKFEHFGQICDQSRERKWNDCDNDNSISWCQEGSHALCQLNL